MLAYTYIQCYKCMSVYIHCVYVCVCVCMYVCILCVYVCIHIRMLVCVHYVYIMYLVMHVLWLCSRAQPPHPPLSIKCMLTCMHTCITYIYVCYGACMYECIGRWVCVCAYRTVSYCLYMDCLPISIIRINQGLLYSRLINGLVVAWI